jgi:hypothetical protein
MATSRNPEQFAKRMGYRAEQVIANAERAVKRAAVAADTTAVLKTPVDTGRARANWVASVSTADTSGPYETEDKAGGSTIARNQATIKGWKRKQGAIYLTNSLPYIQRLDDGYSAQAPNGMSKAAIQAAQAQLTNFKLLR